MNAAPRSGCCLVLAACSLLTLATGVSAGNLPVQRIVLTGDPAPDAGEGVVFSQLWEASLNGNGNAAIFAVITGPGVSGSDNVGIWSNAGGSLALVVREGMEAPGAAPGVEIDSLISTPLLSDSGNTVFEAIASSGPLDFGIWEGTSAGLGKIALQGTPADVPGPPNIIQLIGKQSATFFGGPASNGSGAVAFFGRLSVDGLCVLKGTAGSLSIVANESASAPGTTSNFAAFGRTQATIIPSLNDAGQVAFFATLSPSGNGIWSEAPGTLQLVARNGTPAPGTPAVFSDFMDPRINAAGQTAFTATVFGGGTTSGNNTGIWLESSGQLSLIAREGSQADGLPEGTLYGNLVNAPVLSDAGHLMYHGPLTGAGVNADNNTALWVHDESGSHLVAREGMPAPDAAGIEFGEFADSPDYAGIAATNSAGTFVFNATLRGSGIDPTNDGSIWSYAGGNLRSVARLGDTIEVAIGDVRTVREAWGAFYGSGGCAKAFNHAGQLVFIAYFTDGTHGVFLTSLHEAASGDMNCDGSFDLLDADAMALALVDPGLFEITYPGCPRNNGDFTGDQELNGADIGGFVAALIAP